MTVIVWNEVGKRFYETGVDRGVLYPTTGEGVPWNGLISVNENVSGGETSASYYDGNKFYDFVAYEDFAATIEAFSAPPEFGVCDGSFQLALGLFATQQVRQPFGFSYRTLLGNDVDGTDYGYKLHLVYNATAAPIERNYKSLSDSTDPDSHKWDINCVPILATDRKATAHLVINSKLADPTKLAALETLLYGTVSVLAALPSQATVITTLT